MAKKTGTLSKSKGTPEDKDVPADETKVNESLDTKQECSKKAGMKPKTVSSSSKEAKSAVKPDSPTSDMAKSGRGRGRGGRARGRGRAGTSRNVVYPNSQSKVRQCREETKDSSSEEEEEDSTKDSATEKAVRRIKQTASEELQSSFEQKQSNKPAKVGHSNDYIQEDSDDGSQEETEDGMGSILLDQDDFDDSPDSKRAFANGKEAEMCQLWEEERVLYDSTEPGHRDPNFRADVIRRMALKLQIQRK